MLHITHMYVKWAAICTHYDTVQLACKTVILKVYQQSQHLRCTIMQTIQYSIQLIPQVLKAIIRLILGLEYNYTTPEALAMATPTFMCFKLCCLCCQLFALTYSMMDLAVVQRIKIQ